jgi:hypothetical protein
LGLGRVMMIFIALSSRLATLPYNRIIHRPARGPHGMNLKYIIARYMIKDNGRETIEKKQKFINILINFQVMSSPKV